ncbi:MAG TPA: protein kinase [Solirubrobacteraceae bacterium]|nr:protein kinase [Solirubrobacteraceae bacterium]
MSSGAPARSAPRQPPGLPERYRLRRHIASGGMASVWSAEDRLLDRTVAIKILAERFARDQLAVRRFKREARAAARVCGHNHVVTVFDVGDTEPAAGDPAHEGRAFIVMEYLAGGTVADAIRVGAVRRHEALRWLGEAASAVDHAHGCGIVHRDIKPANFLLDRSRVLHVADFGIARLVSEDTITSSDQLFGTAAYLAPEQALGRPATSASDRYALAVAAFELLVGERPFGATHFAAQARQHVEDEPPTASERNRSLPASVDPILRRGMAKEAGARFESAGELVASLQRALTEVPTSTTRRIAAGPRAPRSSPASPSRRRPSAVPPGRRALAEPALARSRPAPSHRRGRAFALMALAIVILGVVAVGLAASRGGSTKHASSTQARANHTAASTVPRRHPAPRHTAATTSTPAQTSSTATTPTAATSPAQLQQTGHDEMLNGDYQTAIGTLRQAISASDPGTLTYAYALYDLGRSLVLGGDPNGAIPVLKQRLKIPNQTDVVRQMLNQALQAAGQAPEQSQTQTTPAAPSGDRGPGRPEGHGRGHAGPTGGAGLAPAPSHGQRHADGHVVEHVSVSFVD